MTVRHHVALLAAALLCTPLAVAPAAAGDHRRSQPHDGRRAGGTIGFPASADCSRDLADAERAVVAVRQFDPLFEQALAFAARSYCA